MRPEETEPSPRLLVIGYGNSLRGDDALGPVVIERLRARFDTPRWNQQPRDGLRPATGDGKSEPATSSIESNIELLSCHQLTPELAAHVACFELVLFVDASAVGVPGAVSVEPVAPATLPASSLPASSLTHQTQPAALLALALELYGHAPQAMLFTGAGADFRDGECLSAPAREAVEMICRLLPFCACDFLSFRARH